ncbi:MAG TPA: hypothetical protein VI136_13735 [Verrucomicrobiae bacterium]
MSPADPDERRRQIRYLLLAILCVLIGVFLAQVLSRSPAFVHALSTFFGADLSAPGQALLALAAILTALLLLIGYLFLPDKGRRK